MGGDDSGVVLTTDEELWQKRANFLTKRVCVNSKDNSKFGMEDKRWRNRNTEYAMWGSVVGSTILRSTIFGKNSTLLRSTLLKGVIFDKIKNSTLLKIVVV